MVVRQQYGCGVVVMLRWAIEQSCRKHGGLTPLRIELAAPVFDDLVRDIRSLYEVVGVSGRLHFDGIELHVGDFPEPRLIAWDHTVEYL